MTEQVLIQQLNQMPEEMKENLFVFVEYLMIKYKYHPTIQEAGKNGKKPLKAGFLKVTFIPCDDFDGLFRGL